MNPVPNVQPTVHSLPYKIALIGEAPGETEDLTGQPFSGRSGDFLNAILGQAGILRQACLVANVCQVRPPGNDISKFEWESEEIQKGLAQLSDDLEKFDPNICVLLGRTALQAAFGNDCKGIQQYRGSLFTGRRAPFLGRKCISTYHPAACLRQYDWTPVLAFDIRRAKNEGGSKLLSLPVRIRRTGLSLGDILSHLSTIPRGRTNGFDVEGYAQTGISEFSISTDPFYGFHVPFTGFMDGSYWLQTDEEQLWKATGRVLGDPSYRFVTHSMYDGFVMAWAHKIWMASYKDDTLMKGSQTFSEFPRSLAFNTSIYTKEPFYKDDRTSDDSQVKAEYNVTDSCVTDEINTVLDDEMTEEQRNHHQFNMDLTRPFMYMMLRGTKLDQDLKKKMLSELEVELAKEQAVLDGMYSLPCSKTLKRRPAAYIEEGYTQNKDGTWTKNWKEGYNVKSTTQMPDLLYRILALPVQRTRGRGGLPGAVTTNYEAMLKLRKDTKHKVLTPIIRIRQLRTRESQIESLTTNEDGRVRASYTITGTKTMRVACSASSLDTGANLTTIPDDNPSSEVDYLKVGMRGLFVSDPGFDFWQVDLAGADGLTVAAHCKKLGYPTMWDDYIYGIKPAKVLVLMLDYGTVVNSWTRAEIKERSKEVTKEDWRYFCCKQGQHGCYTEGHELLTPSGWKAIKDVTVEDEILIYDNQTGGSWFNKPLRKVEFDYTGELHKFIGTAIDLEVTHDHRMPYETNGIRKWTEAKDILKMKSGKLPITSLYKEGNLVECCKLVAAIHADGCFTERKITFHFRKERKIARLKLLCGEIGVPFKEYKGRDGTTQVEIIDSKWVSTLKKWEKSPSKLMFDWDYQSLLEYVEEYPKWDGTYGPTGSVTIFSAKKENLEWIATFANIVNKGYTWQNETTSGFSSTIYRLQLNNRTQAARASLTEASSYYTDKTKVYCVEVETGFIVVRRNGKTCISGNTNYGMGWMTLQARIFIESEGLYHLPKNEVVKIQNLYLARYDGVQRWQNWVGQQLQKYGRLVSASGHERVFFGRRTDNTTLGEALANEPQENTTYSCNLAIRKLWGDSGNRHVGKPGSLVIEPLMQIHDAVAGQYPSAARGHCHARIKSYFDNPVTIAGETFSLPWEGRYGPSWGNLTGEIKAT